MSPVPPTPIRLAAGDYFPGERALQSPSGRIPLSKTEARLLDRLAATAGAAVSYRELLTDVWGYSSRAESRTVYTTVQRLRLKIELDPSAPTQLLTVAGVGYRLVLPDAPRIAPTPPTAPATFPAELTSLVGRERELELLRAAVTSAALVTVVGPGGTGKTRLTVRVCHASREDFEGGVFFCDLTEARGREEVATHLARGLGVSLGEGDPAVGLGGVLAARGRVLVVLDNLEHVTEHAADVVRVCQASAPRATFLGTSREALHLGGERVFPLGPLPVPAPDATSDEILASPAVQLFLTRLRDVRPTFATDDLQLRAIGELVRGLDGLPLAIELAAARGRSLSPDRMVSLLGRRFDLLANQRRDLTARHSTLRGVIDWSWDLLAPVEQSALAQLSVFRGGLDLDAALAVLDLGGHGAPWAFDVLKVLADRSLVRTIEPAQDGEEYRYGLYESVRAYAEERLAELGPQVVAGAFARHASWYLRHGEPEALGRMDRDGATRRKLARDRDNLVVALERSAAAGDTARAFPLAQVIAKLFSLTGPWELAVSLVRSVLALPGLGEQERGRLNLELALLHQLCGRILEAEVHAAQAEAPARATGDHATLVNALHLQAQLRRLDHPTRAAALDDEALRVAREAGLDHLRAVILGNHALHHTRVGRPHEARALYEEALAVHRRNGNLRYLGVALGGLAHLEVERGRPEAALLCFEEALAVHRAVDNRRSEGILLNNYGPLLESLGRVDESWSVLRLALRANLEVGNLRSASISRANLALSLRDAGRLREAATELEAGLAELRRSGRSSLIHSNLVGSFLAELGLVWIYAGRREEARRCLAESAATSSENAPPAQAAVRCAYEGLLLLDEGDAEAAWRALGTARDRGSLSTATLTPLWALVATRVGRREEAEAALSEGRPADSGRWGDLLLARWAEAEAWRALGREEQVEHQVARFFEVAARFGGADDHPLALRVRRLGAGPLA